MNVKCKCYRKPRAFPRWLSQQWKWNNQSCISDNALVPTHHRWENSPSQPLPCVKPQKSTRQIMPRAPHREDKYKHCEMQSGRADTRSWACQNPKPAMLGAALADVSRCGCNGEWPRGGSGVTDERQRCGQREGEVPGRCPLQCPEEKEQMDKLASFVQKMGPWLRKGAGSSSPCTW